MMAFPLWAAIAILWAAALVGYGIGVWTTMSAARAAIRKAVEDGRL